MDDWKTNWTHFQCVQPVHRKSVSTTWEFLAFDRPAKHVLVCVKSCQRIRPFLNLEAHPHFILVSRSAETPTGYILNVFTLCSCKSMMSPGDVLESELQALLPCL